MELGNKRSFSGTKEIQINNKVITFGNSIICADNISLITISKVPMNMTWIGAIILFYVGVFGIFLNNSAETDFFYKLE